jgi:predicted PurR-regulated permease PerM
MSPAGRGWLAGGLESSAMKLTAFCVAVASLRLAREVLIPVALGVLVAFALEPIVRRLERPMRSRASAVLVTVGTAAVLAAGAITLGAVQGQRLAEEAPEYRETLVRRLSKTKLGAMAVHEVLGDRAVASAGPQGAGPPTRGPDAASGGVASADVIERAGDVLHLMATAMVTAMLATVVLLFREDLRDRLVRILGVDSLPLTRQTLDQASRRVSRFLLTQAGLNALSGLSVGVMLAALGVPNAAILGMLTAVLRFIPYVGVATMGTATFLAALASTENWATPLLVLGLFVTIEGVVSLVLEPWMYGLGAGLSTFGTVVAIFFWGWLWGIPGLLLAVPLTVCVVLLARHFPALEPLSVLLGDAPALTPGDRFHHRLLSRNPTGARDAVVAAGEGSDAGDAVWFESISRAARDWRAGGLSEDDLDGYVRTARAVLATGLKASAAAASAATTPTGAKAGAAVPPAGPGVVAFPSSHPLDVLAAEVTQVMLERRGVSVEVVEPPVMLSQIEGSARAKGARALVVFAAARPSQRRARLLVRALRARVSEPAVVLATLTGPRVGEAGTDGPSRGVVQAGTLGEVLEVAGVGGAAPGAGAAGGNGHAGG